MDLKLKNKTVFISGSTKGIGKAAAERLAREGAEVIINGRSKDTIAETIDRIKKEVPQAKIDGIVCDFAKQKEIDTLIEKLGQVDILVNNVGIFEEKDFFETTNADWQEFYEINVMSGVKLSRALMPKMLKNNWGRILFISSESALNIPVEMIHYGMTKTAMMSIARGLAELTTNTNVTVNSILPGPTRTEGIEANLPDDQTFEEFENAFFKTARPTSIIKRFASPEEVAHMIAYVSSPLSSATNGASLRVDGGVVKTI